MIRPAALILIPILATSVVAPPQCGKVFGQAYGEPDRGQPGDQMIQHYLARQAEALHERFLQDVTSLDQWQANRDQYYQQYLFMLGLWPLPDKTPLQATVTGTLVRDDYVVDRLHFQSRPGLYVTANLYRPAATGESERLPAVLYVCGHSGRGRNGNKTSYQSHGIWFARHGYLCLMVDTLQLGEIASIHHGTYREQRWWWLSRGYTPAGVECWNGIRAIDYLISRADVDPQRIAVTGISGGGAATFWIAAADPRVAVAVPVSGMADLPSYVANRVINGHCDCMFLHNACQWPWTRIAALIAPRPLLFVNSDDDKIFPMDANRRIANRLEDVYRLYGAGDQVDAVVSIGGHAYREDIRRAVYRFINVHLKNDPIPVTDSEVDLVEGRENNQHPINPESLRVFADDESLPSDEKNTTIDQHFVAAATVAPPGDGDFAAWKSELMKRLREIVLRAVPERVPMADPISPDQATQLVGTEEGIQVAVTLSNTPQEPRRVVLAVCMDDDLAQAGSWLADLTKETDVICWCQPRGVGPTRWTRKNPPNYVERAHVLLGRTVELGQITDVASVARRLRAMHPRLPLCVAGSQRAAVVAAYAALLEPDVSQVVVRQPPASHQDADAPCLLNVLRVCDIPHVLGMLAPRPLQLLEAPAELVPTVEGCYRAAAADGQLTQH